MKHNINRYKYATIVLLHTILYVVTPFLTATFINNIINKDYGATIIIAIINVITYLITQFVDYRLDIYEQRIRDDEYVDLIDILNKKFDTYNSNEIELNKEEINQDISQNYELVKNYLSINQINYWIYMLKILIVFAISFYYSIEVAVVVLILSIISIALPNIFAKRLNKNYTNYIGSFKDLQEYTINRLDNHQELRYINQSLLKPVGGLLNTYRKNSNTKTKFESFYMNIISYGLINGSILAVIIISGLLAFNGKLEIGFIYLFQAYMSQLFSPIEFILDYKTKKNSMKEIIDRYQGYSLIKENDYCHDSIKTIEFDNVELFDKRISFKLNRGDLILIKGANGSGKTTLLNKLMGFDNHDNILINGSQKLHDDLVYISSKSHNNRFMLDYKDGSAGEIRIRQINQYVNVDKSLYIFDEPTNYIDANNKDLILKEILKLIAENKIVIVVSHDDIFDEVENSKIIVL